MNKAQGRAAVAAILLAAATGGTTAGVAYSALAAKAPTTRASASTGRLRLTFTERSPLSARDDVLRRLDADLRNMGANADKATLEYNLANEFFEVFVPPAYQPAVPHGLFVWTGVAELPPAWFEVFSRHKLICISPGITTGGKGLLRNAQLPLDAVHNMTRLYTIDESRVYIGGFSAGAGAATQVVCAYPDVFRGGYFLLGGRFYVTHKTKDGQWETTLERMAPKWKGPLDQIKRDMRLVFMRGENDTLYSPQEDRGQSQSLLLDGFTGVTYIEVPGLAHRLPGTFWFEKGIAALDRSTPTTPPTTSPTTQPRPLPGQVAQAHRLLASAQRLLDLKRIDPSPRWDGVREQKAHEYLRQILRDYPTTPAAAKARQLLNSR
jgi:predicted esterase